MMRSSAIAALAALLLPGPIAAAAPGIETGVFHDAGRGRDVPYTAYWPDGQKGPRPVVIFSHGLGGTANAAPYLGRALSRADFIAIHIQHAGSDASVYRGSQGRRQISEALRASVHVPANGRNRFLDLPFVLDTLARRNAAGPWANKMDLGRVGMAGHSYGARSALVAAGQRVGKKYVSLRDARIRAGIAISTSAPGGNLDLGRTFGDISIPLLHITGTKDRGAFSWRSQITPASRLEPYRRIGAPIQYLLVLEGADHYVFSAKRLGTRREKPLDRAHIASVGRLATAFFQAHLLGDAQALAWLRSEFSKTLAAGDRFTIR
jgi:predicted dienelactone hydrolase